MNKDGSVKMRKKATIYKPNVVVLKREVLEDRELSLEAKGFYGTLMYLSTEFGSCSKDEMHEACPELSKAKIEELLNELNKAGYLT